MAQVTNGRITYGRTVQPAQYESKRMDAEIVFSVGEGEGFENMLNLAAYHAIDKVHESLGLPRPGKPANCIQGAIAVNGVALQDGPTKSDLAAEAEAKIGKPADGKKRGPKKPPAVAEVDPAAVDVVADQPGGETSGGSEGALDVDPAAVEDVFTAEAAPITDKDLTDATARKNQIIKNPVAIRQLIGKYVAPPKQLREIAHEHRANFLTELAAL